MTALSEQPTVIVMRAATLLGYGYEGLPIGGRTQFLEFQLRSINQSEVGPDWVRRAQLGEICSVCAA